MKKEIVYSLKVSTRTRRMRLQIHRNGELVVTVPKNIEYGLIEKFITEKSTWIAKKIRYVDSIKDKIFLNSSKREYVTYKEKALMLAENRITYYNRLYRFNINSIRIKNTKSRWGSCSKKGNLNFSYKIALLPKDLADYIIVHELCHLGEFNHSKRFWALVSKAIPNYLELRKNFK